MDRLQAIQTTNAKNGHLLGIAILIAFLLPHSSVLLQLANPLLCLLMVYKSKGRKFTPLVYAVIVPIVLSLLTNAAVVTQKAFLSTFTVLLYFACFPIVGSFKINNIYLYVCLGYIFISQVCYMFGVSFLVNLFDRLYPIDEFTANSYEQMKNSISYITMFDYRLGGFYHNPNQCSRYITMLLAFFLVVNQGVKSKGILVFTAIAYIAVLLTGSRTGFVIASLILYFGLLRQKAYSGNTRYLFLAIAVAGIGYILESGYALRGLNVEEGMSGSANIKWETFVYYLTNEQNFFTLLVGHLDPSLFVVHSALVMEHFDSEYGELIFRYGIIGFLGIFFFWWKTAMRIHKTERFFFLLLLWTISSTIVASYRALFIFMLFLSIIYSNNVISSCKKGV